MWIAEAKKKTAKRWRNKEVSWEQFCSRLEAPMRTAETMREYRAMSKEERDVLKELPGGFVAGYLTDGMRKTEHVRERSMITLDADHATPDDWDNFTLLYGGIACACYSTHSHTPEHPRLRWLFPTTRPMLPEEYQAVARRVAEWVGIETIDATTYDLCRLFYYPGVSQDATYVFHVQPGQYVNPDEVLASYGPEGAWRDSTLWPIAAGEQEIRVRELKRLGDPRDKPGNIGRFCRTYDIYEAIDTFLPDVYEEAGPDRYTYTRGSTAGGARVYNGGLYLYSSHATDPAGGQSCNAFDLVRLHKFGHLDEVTGEDTPVTKLPSYEAMSAWVADLPEIKAQLAAEKQAEVDEVFGDLTGAGTKTAAGAGSNGGDEPEGQEDNSWTAKLDLNKKTGECEPTIANALLIMLNDPALKGAIAYDTFAEAPKLRKDVPWRPKGSVVTTGKGTGWEDWDEAGLRWYMQTRWKFKSENDLRNALEMCFRANSYHPVREYLNGLVWDGKERLDTMFIDLMGADDTAFVRTATRKWMCGAVARVMVPGIKFDQAIVLNSKQQGLGKSSFSRILSRGWYSDSAVNMNDKDGYAVLHGNWIIELAELASTKRSDVETVKTFLSKCEDTYRPAYARRVATFPRQCVFYGTTNEQEYLKDRTGNRRFWTITVDHLMDQQELENVADQLWAEAVVRWRQGEQLWISDPAIIKEWQAEVDRHTVQDDLEGIIVEYLDTLLPDNWGDLSPEARRDWINGDIPGASPGTVKRQTVCLPEIKTELLKEDRTKAGGNDLLTRRLSCIMNTMEGWDKAKKKVRVPGYGPQWVYIRRPRL